MYVPSDPASEWDANVSVSSAAKQMDTLRISDEQE